MHPKDYSPEEMLAYHRKRLERLRTILAHHRERLTSTTTLEVLRNCRHELVAVWDSALTLQEDYLPENQDPNQPLQTLEGIDEFLKELTEVIAAILAHPNFVELPSE